MLKTLSDVVKYSKRLAATLPALEDSILLKEPGCTELEIAMLTESLADMPPEYVQIARAIQLNRVAIGYFQLSPGGFGGTTLAEKVIRANSKENPFKQWFESNLAYQVGSWEADPIAIVFGTKQHQRGAVIKFNSGQPEQPPKVLSHGYEAFLLLAANLDDVRNEYSEQGNAAEAVSEFMGRVALLGCTHEIHSTWQSLAEIVLE